MLLNRGGPWAYTFRMTRAEYINRPDDIEIPWAYADMRRRRREREWEVTESARMMANSVQDPLLQLVVVNIYSGILSNIRS